MATYTLAAGERSAPDKSTVASTVDTVTFVQDCSQVEVISDGAATLYVRVDGSAPVVGGAFAYVLPSGSPSVRVISPPTGGGTVVKLISAGVVKYTVGEL